MRWVAVILGHLVTQALLGNIFQEDSFQARGSWDEPAELDPLENELGRYFLGSWQRFGILPDC